MELTIDKRKKVIDNVNNFHLSFWDMCFWQNNPMKVSNEKDINRLLYSELDRLYAELLKSVTLKNFEIYVDNNKELDAYLKQKIQALKNRDEYDEAERLEQFFVQEKHNVASLISKRDFDYFNDLVKCLENSKYEKSFKYLLLKEALIYTYKMDYFENEARVLVKKKQPHKTLMGNMNLPEEVIEYIYKNGKNAESFKKLYIDAQLNFQNNLDSNKGIVLANVKTFGKGKWLKFNGACSDLNEYRENVEKLKALVVNTPWCTSTQAETQLWEGDFYVFVDNDNSPHIAVKMIGSKIGEVRGIFGGNLQEIEQEYRDVAINFLQNNADVENGKIWLEKEEWNNRLVKYNSKILEGKLNINQIEPLLNDVFIKPLKMFNNTNLKNLLSNLEKVSSLFETYFNCSKDEICFDSYIMKNKNCPYKVILGGANLIGVQSAENLKYIYGNVNFIKTSIKELPQLFFVAGYANFANCKGINIPKLKQIKRSANFRNCEDIKLPSLEEINGNVSFENAKMIQMDKLSKIKGEANFGGAYLMDLSSLKIIEGDANFKNSEIESLSGLTIIKGDAIFSYSRVGNLDNLMEIQGNAVFTGSQISSLKNLNKVGKSAVFTRSEIVNLQNLEVVNKNLFLQKSRVYKLGKLKKADKVTIEKSRVGLLKNMKDLNTLVLIGFWGNCKELSKEDCISRGYIQQDLMMKKT